MLLKVTSTFRSFGFHCHSILVVLEWITLKNTSNFKLIWWVSFKSNWLSSAIYCCLCHDIYLVMTDTVPNLREWPACPNRPSQHRARLLRLQRTVHQASSWQTPCLGPGSWRGCPGHSTGPRTTLGLLPSDCQHWSPPGKQVLNGKEK